MHNTNIRFASKKEEYVIKSIRSVKDLIELVSTKKIYLKKFIYNCGLTPEVRDHNNYCEFLVRVNKESIFYSLSMLLSRDEVEEVLLTLNSVKCTQNTSFKRV